MKKDHVKTGFAIGLSLLALYLLFTQSGKDIAARLGVELMKLTDSGLKLIAEFEGFSATPYPDAQGQSIGYGHFIKAGENIQWPITEEQALDLLKQDAASANTSVNSLVKVPLTQNQHDALVSLVYNIGSGAFAASTLLKLLNAGDYTGAAEQFARWNKSRDASGNLTVNQSLVARRASEASLFMEA